MLKRFVTIAGVATLATSTLLADFSYQETTRITGGALVGMLKMAGVFSKQARQAGEPMQSTVSIKGDRMVHRGAQHTTIIDLGSQTITSVDLDKKTYSVMTFEQMKQAMAQMSEKMHQKDGPDTKMNVSSKNTGKSKQINGFDAKEMVLKMEMQSTDPKSGQTVAMVVNADTWIAPGVPGYNEVREFYRKMGEKLNWSPGGNMFMSRPDVAKGMAEVYKESAKLDGVPVFQTTTMGPEGTEPVDRAGQPVPAEQPSAKPSVGGALGGALGGKFGLGRKKPQQDTPPPAASGDQANSGALLEMTTEMGNFSSNPVDASQFEIPAGFKKVESDLRRGGAQ